MCGLADQYTQCAPRFRPCAVPDGSFELTSAPEMRERLMTGSDGHNVLHSAHDIITCSSRGISDGVPKSQPRSECGGQCAPGAVHWVTLNANPGDFRELRVFQQHIDNCLSVEVPSLDE